MKKLLEVTPAQMVHAEALRLADALEQQFPIGTAQHYLDGEAAAELRRLSAESDALRKANEAFAKRQEWWNEKMFALETLNAELLMALKYIDKEFRKHGRQHWPEAVKARAAIAKAGEKA
jgi:hypothetical protein